MPIADVYPSAINAVTLLGRAVTRGDNSRGGEYSYTRVLPDGFPLKAIVFTVCEHDYMNIPPAPNYPVLLRPCFWVMLCLSFQWNVAKYLNLSSPVDISLCVATVNRLPPDCLVTSCRKVFEILHKLNVCLLSNFATNGSLTVLAHLPGRGLRGSPCKNRPLEFLKITDFLQTFCVEEVIHKMNKKR
jgi:hypothetical protein